jgi:hypothetical protein
MCDLYSCTRPQDAARKLARVERDLAGNMPPLPPYFPREIGIFLAIVPLADIVGTCVIARWLYGPVRDTGAIETEETERKRRARRCVFGLFFSLGLALRSHYSGPAFSCSTGARRQTDGYGKQDCCFSLLERCSLP